MSSKHKTKKIVLFAIHKVVAVILMLIILVPFYVAVVYAFKPKSEVGHYRLALPEHWTLENFIQVVFRNDTFFIGFRNSLVSTIPTVLLLLLISSMAAYILARNKGTIYSVLYTILTAGILVPFQCIMLSLYLNFFRAGLVSSNIGYIIARVGMQVSISVLVVASFVKTIPYELEEAARIDGAGMNLTFSHIILPLMKPVNITQLVLNTLFCWNDYNVAIVLLRTRQSRTLPLAQIIYFNENTSELNYAFAFFIMTMIPVLILYFCMQKYIVQGIMSGAVKG